VYRQTTPEKGALRLWFDHAKELASKGGALTGFEVAGADGEFVPAVAAIEGETIVIGSPQVAEPLDVRYAWANAVQYNLFNDEGLSASPFPDGKMTRQLKVRSGRGVGGIASWLLSTQFSDSYLPKGTHVFFTVVLEPEVSLQMPRPVVGNFHCFPLRPLIALAGSAARSASRAFQMNADEYETKASQLLLPLEGGSILSSDLEIINYA
jgi:hypothetical protein